MADVRLASSTEEILKSEWVEVFDGFSRQHEGWLVTVEVLDPEIGSQVEAANVPLEGISVDLKGSEVGSIDLMLGGTPDRHATHGIGEPTRVWFQKTAEGAHESLEIESADGGKTLVHFRAPALPELLDGVLP